MAKTHIRIEYYYADQYEQYLFHLNPEDVDKVKKMFEDEDQSAIREFIDEQNMCSVRWFEEPYNVRMSIEVNGEPIDDGGHGSRFIYEDSMINASSECPTLQYMTELSEASGEDIEDHMECNESLFITPGNEDAEIAMKDSEFWKKRSEEEVKDIPEDEREWEFADNFPQMSLFDSYISEHGTEKQLCLIETLHGEGESAIEFDIEGEFDIEKLKFIYDNSLNPEYEDEKIFMDRVVYDGKLYANFDIDRILYDRDKFALGYINDKGYPGWLSYEKEIELEMG